jgi:hypothetical protein
VRRLRKQRQRRRPTGKPLPLLPSPLTRRFALLLLVNAVAAEANAVVEDLALVVMGLVLLVLSVLVKKVKQKTAFTKSMDVAADVVLLVETVLPTVVDVEVDKGLQQPTNGLMLMRLRKT